MVDVFTMILGFLAVAALIAVLWTFASAIVARDARPPSKRDWQRLDRTLGGPSSDYSETDLRLTYQRFKELYPFSQITYKEYKALQSRKAYKRSVSSQTIKRMVR